MLANLVAQQTIETNAESGNEDMKLDAFPHIPLAHLPTPLEPLPRLSEHLGGPKIYVKRDDATGLALGGNKTRKLEYLLADALDRGADTIVTTGGLQSNHARQTAAAAARLGLRCELLLPRLVPLNSAEYEQSGNVLLDRLCGAQLHVFSAAEFSAETIDQFMHSVRTSGRKPYFIPTGGSTPVGALGYLNAVVELRQQTIQAGLHFDAMVVATGSAGTHAGILAGLVHTQQQTRVLGIAVSATRREKEDLVRHLAEEVLHLVGESSSGLSDQIVVDDRFVGPGYGLPTDEMIEAVRLVAGLEGLMLDPVYTGKAMAGLIAAVRRKQWSTSDSVLFWHTGGTPGLFAYSHLF